VPFSSDFSTINYSASLCPKTNEIKNGVMISCPKGDSCIYAHSTDEVLYHPMVYKT
jgi:hypothetical protein